MKTDKTRKTENGKERLYVAYGSNLNTAQMAVRCPTAGIAGAALLKGWRLMFRGACGGAVATIERRRGYVVPVLVWRLEPEDEKALDRYEGWPHLYRKEMIKITLDDRRRSAMVYIMNEDISPYGTPSLAYRDTIRQGYKEAGFDLGTLYRASDESWAEGPRKRKGV